MITTVCAVAGVRVATADDLPRIVSMGQHFLRSSRYAELFDENPAQMRALALRLIDGPANALLVLERGDLLMGMIGLVAYDHFISGTRIAGEVFYWVEPEARGSGLRLLRAAEPWAREQGARSLQMISPDDRTDRLYQRLGYLPVERTFQRSVA